MAKRKTYSASFKSKVALEALRGEMTIAEQLASKYGVNPVMVTRWKKQAVDGMAETFSKRGQARRDASDEAQIKELHAKIGELRDPNSLPRRSQMCCKTTISRYPWTAKGPGWIMSSSKGCGGPLNTNASISMSLRMSGS